MQEIDNDIFLEEEQENIIRKQEEDQVKERSTEDIQVIKEVKETIRDKEIDEKIVTFLYEKGLNENLVKTLIDTDYLTDEHVRLLKTLNLCDNDIDNLQDLWQGKIEVNKSRNSTNSDSTSDNSTFNDNAQLSSNSIYLKKVLSKPLIEALCEIVEKKPVDPVEYLGHWLLHYKICEERAMQQKERELELPIDRKKSELKEIEDKEEEYLFIEQKEYEEEYGEDRIELSQIYRIMN